MASIQQSKECQIPIAMRDNILTTRLILVFLDTTDAKSLYQIWEDKTDIELPISQAFSSVSTTRSTIELTINSPLSFAFSIRPKAFPDNVIGAIGLHTGDHDSVFYRAARAMRGQGIMTEALSAFIPALFARQPGRSYLRADTIEQNAPSIRVLEKCGFEKVKHRTEDTQQRELNAQDESDLKEAATALIRDLGTPVNVQRETPEGQAPRVRYRYVHYRYQNPGAS